MFRTVRTSSFLPVLASPVSLGRHSVWLQLALATVLLCSTNSRGQTLTIEPASALIDQPVVIRAGGLTPGEAVSIRSELEDASGHTWQADAQFIADGTGSLDLSKSPALKGSYRGVSAMGLVWAMRSNGEAHIYQPPRNLGSQNIHFTLHSKTGDATAQLEQRSLDHGVHMVQVNGSLHGVLFLPSESIPMPAGEVSSGTSASARRPALLVVGGSEGGTPVRRAAWLANHGYVTLALAYFHVPGLPDQLRDIPLEYLGSALHWLADRHEVDPERIGVVGASRGGELALELGSLYSVLHAVVAFVPSDVRVPACCDGGGGAAWTWHGRPLAYAGVQGYGKSPDLPAEIAVENTRGPILVISGNDDGVWPSSQMTARIESRLKGAHFRYEVVRLDYPKAGHRAGAPEIAPAWTGSLQHPVSGQPEELGGTPDGNATSGLDAAPRVLAFLARSFSTKVPDTAAATVPSR